MTVKHTPQKMIYPSEPPDDLARLLRDAIDRRDLASCRQLLDRGANPNAPVGAYNTLFTHAIFTKVTDCALLMLGYGANLEPEYPDEISPLRCAARADNVEMCRELLSLGAAVDATDSLGETAFYAAAFASSTETGRLLIEAGADAHVCDRRSLNALHRSALSFNSKAMDFTKLLLDVGLDPDFRPEAPAADYLTPFQWALQCGRRPIAAYLIDNCGYLVEGRTLAGQHLSEIVSTENASLLMAELTARSVEAGVGACAPLVPRKLAIKGIGPL